MIVLLAACEPGRDVSEAGDRASPSEGREQILAALRAADPDLRAEWDEREGRIVLQGRLAEATGQDAVEVARRFLTERSIPRPIDGEKYALVVHRSREGAPGWRHVTFDQTYRGLPVWGRQIVVHVDPDGRVRSVNGTYLPEVAGVETRASLEADEAVTLAEAAPGPGSAERPPFSEPELVLFEAGGSYRAAWKFTLPGTDGAGPAEWRFFVDARTGQILQRSNRVRSAATQGSGVDCDLVTRTLEVFEEGDVFQLRDETRIPGGSRIHTLVRGADFATDPDGTWDETEIPVRTSQQPEVTIHFWLGRSYDVLRELTGREGWDDDGLPIVGYAHYPGFTSSNNAYWSPEKRAVLFGKSEGDTFRAFGCANDIIAHEFMHGVVEYTAGFNDKRDPNAMDESFADIFAVMVDGEDWALGEGAFQSGARAMRFIADPTLGGHPNHYDDMGGEEHANSNVTSYAFYLAAEGLEHESASGYTCDVSLGKVTAFDHFYYALDNFLTSSSTMPDLSASVSFIASQILARGRGERGDVFDEAFRRVGLGEGGQPLACAEPWIWLAF